MRVFLSWSGRTSRLVAQALRDWLPDVIQTLEPWLSSEDIPYGARWQSVVSEAVKGAAVSIICLTQENVGEKWLTYEAGTLATVNSLICPYLLDLQPSDMGVPFVQFQSARANRSDTHRLVRILNERSGSDSLPDQVLDRAFELHWPSLEARLAEIRRLVPLPLTSKTLEQKVDEALRLLSVLVDNACAEPVAAQTTLREPGVKPRVFIGSSSEGLQVAELIQLGLERSAECTLWTQATFAASQTTIEGIVDASVQYDFAILVLTADDMVNKRGIEAAGPRDNVLFELGLFTGALGRARTFMVLCRDEKVQLPTDLNGVTAVTYARRSDGNLEAALGPVCTRIKQAMGVSEDYVRSPSLR